MTHPTLAPRSRLASKRHSFFVGFIQMFLVVINNRNMAHGHLLFLVAFTLINTHVLVYVVRTVIHSTFWEIFIYGLGSATGAVLGVLAHYYLIKPNAVFHLASLM